MRRPAPWLLAAIGFWACSGGAEEAPARTTPVARAEPEPAPVAEPAPPPEPPPPPSLFERLGGNEAVTLFIDDLVTRALADRRIKRFFRRIDRDRMVVSMVQQICAVADGGCEYEGRSMEQAHRGLRLTSAHFDALLEDLGAALDAAGIAEAEKAELLDLLGPMRSQVAGQ